MARPATARETASIREAPSSPRATRRQTEGWSSRPIFAASLRWSSPASHTIAPGLTTSAAITRPSVAAVFTAQ
jgi:hypothetical protein